MLRRLLPIIFLLSVGFPVLAQDATVEPTPESTPVVIVTPAPVVTPAPAPVLTPDNAISISTILYGLIIAVLGGGTVGFVLNKFGSNKANLDAAEKLYQSLSPESQAHLRQMFESLREITVRSLDIVDKVTDGQPNAEVAIENAFENNPYLSAAQKQQYKDAVAKDAANDPNVG